MKFFFSLVFAFCIIWFFSKFIGCSFKKGVFNPGMITPMGYHVRDHRVYYYGGLMNAYTVELEGVDAASFEKVVQKAASPETVLSSSYARDKRQVYYNGKVLPGADPATFEVTGFARSKDKNHVYDYLRAFSDDPEHYRHFKDELYIDQDHIYWGTVVLSDEPQNLRFTVSADTSSLTYYADSKGVFASNGMRMPDVDVETFKPLPGMYCADKNHVYQFDYLELKIVKGADPANFKIPASVKPNP